MLYRVETLKTEIYRIRVDGRIRRFSNTMSPCLGCRTDDSKTLRVDAVFKFSIFESNTRLRVDG